MTILCDVLNQITFEYLLVLLNFYTLYSIIDDLESVYMQMQHPFYRVFVDPGIAGL